MISSVYPGAGEAENDGGKGRNLAFMQTEWRILKTLSRGGTEPDLWQQCCDMGRMEGSLREAIQV